MKKSTLLRIISFITYFSWFCYVISELILFIFVCQKKLMFWVFMIATLSSTVSMILLVGLNGALRKIEILGEILIKKEVIKEQDFELVEEENIVEEVSFCPECGYQLFPDDKVCPNCNKVIKK